MRILVLTGILMLAITLAPSALANDHDDVGIHPCPGGYYVEVLKFETECLPGLPPVEVKECPGWDRPGTGVYVNGNMLICMY